MGTPSKPGNHTTTVCLVCGPNQRKPLARTLASAGAQFRLLGPFPNLSEAITQSTLAAAPSASLPAHGAIPPCPRPANTATSPKSTSNSPALCPDIFVIGLEPGPLAHSDAITSLRSAFPRIPILVVGPADANVLYPTLLAGARGYITNHPDCLPRLGEGISALLSNKLLYLGPAAAGLVAGRQARMLNFVSGCEHLSPRERQILSHIPHGRADKEIAERTGLSVETVHTHNKNIRLKLGVANRAEAAAKFLLWLALQGGTFDALDGSSPSPPHPGP